MSSKVNEEEGQKRQWCEMQKLEVKEGDRHVALKKAKHFNKKRSQWGKIF